MLSVNELSRESEYFLENDIKNSNDLILHVLFWFTSFVDKQQKILTCADNKFAILKRWCRVSVENKLKVISCNYSFSLISHFFLK